MNEKTELPAVLPGPTVKSFPQLFWGLVAIAISLTLASGIGAVAIRSLRSGETLTVIGSAKRPIRADHVVWRSSVSSQQPTLAQAFQEVKRYTEQVQAYLKSQNIPAEQITLSAVSTEPIPEYINNNPTGRTLAYRLVQSFEVSSPDVDQIAAISRSSTDLINEGVPLVSDPPRYLYTNLSQLRVEMIKEATEDAKVRADAIAGVTGSRVGSVRQAETDAFQITARYSTDVINSGSYDTQTIDKDITAVISVTFSVD